MDAPQAYYALTENSYTPSFEGACFDSSMDARTLTSSDWANVADSGRRVVQAGRAHSAQTLSDPSTLNAIAPTVQRIDELLDLPDDWDSYGGTPPTIESAERAVWILDKYVSDRVPQPAVNPTPAGGIQLEWHRNNVDLEIVIPSHEAAPVEILLVENVGSDEHATEFTLHETGTDRRLLSALEAVAGALSPSHGSTRPNQSGTPT